MINYKQRSIDRTYYSFYSILFLISMANQPEFNLFQCELLKLFNLFQREIPMIHNDLFNALWRLRVQKQPYTKISTRWIISLNVNSWNYKTQSRNQEYLWPWVWQWFFRYDNKSMNNKENIDKLCFIKIKNFNTLKIPSRKWKTANRCEKIFA